jgi:hypothetical protein
MINTNFEPMKIKMILCLLKHQAMKTYGMWKCSSTHSCPSYFTHSNKSSVTQWIESWVDTRSWVDNMERRKTSCPCHESNLCSLVVQTFVWLLYWLNYPSCHSRHLKWTREHTAIHFIYMIIYDDYSFRHFCLCWSLHRYI